MSKKQIWIIGMLMLVSAAIGALLVTNSANIPLGFAQGSVQLGAEKAPIAPTNEVQALNEAYMAVSKAVTPQVVYIRVTANIRPSSSDGRDESFEDFPWFSFPDRPMPRQGSGSGVIVTGDGYILTNNHVVEGASDEGIQVELHDGRQYTARLIGNDPTTDLAVIKIDGENLPAAAFGNSDQTGVGQIVFAVGNPLGLTSTVTQGIVSAIGRGQLNLNADSEGYGIEDFIQTDAAINPGNSGGGLFNLSGELIGINSAIATQTGYSQGYGFAIPVNLVKAVALDLIEDGRVNRGYIGVMIRNVDQKLARYYNKEYGFDRTDGVMVDGIQPGSAAAVAGLKQGDIILEIDGSRVGTSNQLQSLIARKRVGDNVQLKVFRYGDLLDKTVRLKPRDENESVADMGETDSELDFRGGGGSSRGKQMSGIGMEVGPLDGRTARQRDVDNGVIVTGVDVYGEAMSQGIREGDVIVSVNRKAVSSPDQFQKALSEADEGDVVLLEIQRSNGMKSLVALEINEQEN